MTTSDRGKQVTDEEIEKAVDEICAYLDSQTPEENEKALKWLRELHDKMIYQNHTLTDDERERIFASVGVGKRVINPN